VRPQMYEITFAGQAGSTLRAEFDDCEVIVGRGTTTLRAELPDQAAVSGHEGRGLAHGVIGPARVISFGVSTVSPAEEQPAGVHR